MRKIKNDKLSIFLNTIVLHAENKSTNKTFTLRVWRRSCVECDSELIRSERIVHRKLVVDAGLIEDGANFIDFIRQNANRSIEENFMIAVKVHTLIRVRIGETRAVRVHQVRVDDLIVAVTVHRWASRLCEECDADDRDIAIHWECEWAFHHWTIAELSHLVNGSAAVESALFVISQLSR